MRAPVDATSSGVRPFTDPCVPTGMNVGRSTSPWGVSRMDRRAGPSLQTTRNEKPSVTVDQHRIAVGKEAIAFANGGSVRIEDSLAPAKRANEREQRGARQMKIGEQEIDGAK